MKRADDHNRYDKDFFDEMEALEARTVTEEGRNYHRKTLGYASYMFRRAAMHFSSTLLEALKEEAAGIVGR